MPIPASNQILRHYVHFVTHFDQWENLKKEDAGTLGGHEVHTLDRIGMQQMQTHRIRIAAVAAVLIAHAVAAPRGLQNPHATNDSQPPGSDCDDEPVFVTVPHMSAAAAAVDAFGNIYLTGYTTSRNFPVTADAVKRACDPSGRAGSCTDAVVVKLNRSGRIVYATRLGGSSEDLGKAIAVGADGKIYVAGQSWSTDFPLLHELTVPRSAQQGFVSILSPQGRLIFSTAVPGEGLTSIAVDSSGSVAIGGIAYFETSPLVNPMQPAIRGSADAFVAKLVGDPPRYAWSTYLGGSTGESAQGVAIREGRVYVTGATLSPDFPVVRAFQRTSGGSNDGFVASLSDDGQTLDFSTYIGGSKTDLGRAIALGPDGSVFISGTTSSVNFPATEDAFDPACGSDGLCNPTELCTHGFCSFAPSSDAFVARFDRFGLLSASSFLGGTGSDVGHTISVDASGQLLVSGSTTSVDIEGVARSCGCASSSDCRIFVASVSPSLDAISGSYVPVHLPFFEYVTLAPSPFFDSTVVFNTLDGATVALTGVPSR